jgi:hypothetical protein
MKESGNVVPLDPYCDPRIDSLTAALETVIDERSVGKLPFVTVIGALELVKQRILLRMDLE